MKDIRMLLLMEARLRNQYMRPRLMAMGLTPGQGQARILDCLRTEEPLSQRALADACRMDATAMSRSIDRMVAAGFLKREANPDSRRAHCIGLTEKGREKAAEAHALLASLDAVLEGCMDEEERAVFLRVLEKMCARLEAAAEEA